MEVLLLQSLHRKLITSLFAALPLLYSGSVQAFESDWIKGKAGASQVRLLGEFRSVGVITNEVKFGLEFKLKAGWHIYWKNPGMIGFPPKLTPKLPEGWRVNLLFPAPFRIPIKDRSDAYAFGYERNVIYPVIFQGKPVKDNFEGELKVDYLVCDIQCVPESAEFSFSLPVAKESISPFFNAINQAVGAVPQKSTGFHATKVNERRTRIELVTTENVSDLFLYSKEKVEWIKIEKGTSPQIWEVESKATTPPFEFTAVWNSAAARTGVVGEVAPSTLMAAGSLGSNIATSTDSRGVFERLSEYALALVFAFLGGLILNLMPCVLPVVGIKTISLLKLREKDASYKKPILFTISGILFSFVSLALVTVSLKSFGHQIGWGFQFQSPVFVTFMIVVIFLFALNLFDLFEIHIGARSANAATSLQGSFFEGVFATLLATPCSAPFLGTALTFALSQSSAILILMFVVMGLGLSTPYAALLFFPSLLKFLPKPGAWMNSLKRLLGYSLLFAVFFLLYVVHQQTETLFIFAILGILFGIFIVLKEIAPIWKWILVLALSLWSFQLADHSKRGEGAKILTTESHSAPLPFSTEKLDELLLTGRPVFVLVTADWCLTCKYNEKTVIETDWFQEMLKSKNVAFMIADWTQRDDRIGKFLEAHGRFGIPFSMLIDKSHELVMPELLSRGIVEDKWATFFGN